MSVVPFDQNDLSMALIVTRREVKDSFRDWRIMIPIVILTLFFPALMNFTAGRLLSFVSDFGADIIATRLIPFLLLVVGFFPTSFSLVIALETFVGEKERLSLEPLLATPLTNTQLYLGKVLAAVVPPLTASYLGITVYLVGLAITVNWYPSAELFFQTLLITTLQGLVMVSGAVVISSQTTSVRASNLLASFIIVPMALLLQVEAVAMFWANTAGLWWIIFGMAVGTLVLVRMGIRVFNREELLGRDIDQIRIGWMWITFWGRYTGRDENGKVTGPLTWYKQTLALIPELRTPAGVLLIAFLGAIVLGIMLARYFPFSPEAQAFLSTENIAGNLDLITGFVGVLPLVIVAQNIRVLLLGAILGVFTFGVLAVLVFMLPFVLLGFLGAQIGMAGSDPAAFMLATVIPHSLIEFPTLLLAFAAMLRWQAVVMSPPAGQTMSEAFIRRGGDFMRIFLGLVLPLLLIGALVEAYITPQIAQLIFGS